MALDGSIPAGGRMFVGNGTAVQDLKVDVPAGAQVRMQTAFELPDGSGTVELIRGDAVLDAVSYGKFFGLDAANAYLDGSSLKSVQRKGYPTSLGGGVVIGPPAFGGGLGMEVDVIDPEIEPVALGKPAIGRYALARGWKAYELKNHLGNVLAVVSDLKIGKGALGAAPLVGHYEADVLEMADYYPFGMVLPKRSWTSGGRYRFGFQGQEVDDEWNGKGNSLAFKYRIHDARLGRFLSVDPLAGKYAGNSVYAFAENKVIRYVELEGLETGDPFIDAQIATDPTVIAANLRSAYENEGATWAYSTFLTLNSPVAALAYLGNRIFNRGETNYSSVNTSVESGELTLEITSAYREPAPIEVVANGLTLASAASPAPVSGYLAKAPTAQALMARMSNFVQASLNYSNEVSHLVQNTVKRIDTKTAIPGREIISYTKSGTKFDAFTIAKSIVFREGEEIKPLMGRRTANYPEADKLMVGFQSLDGSRNIRIDWDENLGAHINWKNSTTGENGAIPFAGATKKVVEQSKLQLTKTFIK